MGKKTFFLRYTLALKRLQQSRSTFKELSEYLDCHAEFSNEVIGFSKRTFQRDIQDIRAIFNIDILYDRKTKAYFIDNVDKSGATDRMLETFEMFNALNLTDGLSHFIQFERRKPQGTNHFHGLLHCIKNHFVVSFSYHKYDDDMIVDRKVEPYALKEFKSRWYLIAKDRNDSYVKTFGLDRIRELSITKKKFKPDNDFNVNDLYREYFGIVNTSTDKAEEIILSFDKFNGKYIKSFPLHESQQILTDNEKETRIRLFLHTTLDFEIELLSHGDRVKVIAPDSLRKRVRGIYENALDKNKD